MASGYNTQTGIVIVEGSAKSVSVSLTITTGISEIEKLYNIYANPISESIFINLENVLSGCYLQIVDVSCKIIYMQSILDNETSIYISNFKKGIYIIILKNNNKSYTEKSGIR